MGRKVNIGGLIFGSWEVIYRVSKTNNGHSHYKVKCTNCSCEKFKTVPEIKQNVTCISCRGMPKGQAGLNELFDKYRRDARKFGRSFDLTIEQVRDITSSNCFYCGAEPWKVKQHRRRQDSWGNYVFNGIDRKDNSLGYIIENCLPCCEICNRAKSDMLYSDFILYIERLANRI